MKIEVIPRIYMEKVSYTLQELPKDQTEQIINKRLDMALSTLKLEKRKVPKGKEER